MRTENDEDVYEIIQLMRTLTVAQLRRQLERHKRYKPLTFGVILEFFKLAKEQPK